MTSHQTVVLLLGLALILLVARLIGMVATRFGQPAVIGEVLAGIIIGPTLFGGWISNTLFPTDVRPFLSTLANVGVVVFMFVVGVELDRKLLQGNGRTVFAVSSLSILLPFGLGVALAVELYPRYGTTGQLGFVLFLGAAMSITAFPVLARILTDRGLNRTRLGALSLACAAVGDLIAWCLLAAVVILVTGTKSNADHWLILYTIPYVALMFLVVRPVLRKVALRWTAEKGLTLGALTTILAGMLVSAGLTEFMGLHFIFGAFLFGIIIPREGTEALREDLIVRVGQVSSVLLLPVYFVVAGFNVDLSRLGTSGLWDLAMILAVAIVGKFLGAFTGARISGLAPRESTAVGLLMNTRGLTELIILSVGLQLGILDGRLYTLMVVMAVVTTVMAGPLLSLVHPSGSSSPATLSKPPG